MTGRRVTIVASELLGRPGTGGAGTADSLLAVALGRHGHSVDLLVASGREIGPINPRWSRAYEAAGVRVRVLEPARGVGPAYLAPTFEVLQALRERPPEVAVVNDWRGLGYSALRARQTGRALAGTAVVVHCHGAGRVLTAFAQKVPDTVERFGEQLAEQTSIGLADAVVSPSRWLLDWMRDHRWPVPDGAQVIQYLRESVALGSPSPAAAPESAPIRRLAFFGQLREGKGIRIFLAGVNQLEPELLDGVELMFLGAANRRWPASAITAALPPAIRGSARIETDLPREEALAALRRAGTLAVMPSLLDNSPNTVAECIENRIPFIATATGGIPELVAEVDRGRVLCAPTAEAVAVALRRALSEPAFHPAQAARKPQASLEAWLELVATVQPAPPPVHPPATRIAVVASDAPSEERAHRLATRARCADVEVLRDRSRRSGAARARADWIVFLDDDDEPADELLDALVSAQAASGADAVTVAIRSADAHVHLFLGDPGPLGLMENQYGVVGLVRASKAVAALPADAEAPDPDWPLFARVALSGGRIVSIPEVLSTHLGRPGRVDDVPGNGLAVLEAFEAQRSPDHSSMPQFAATLAAASRRSSSRDEAEPARRRGFLRALKTRIGAR